MESIIFSILEIVGWVILWQLLGVISLVIQVMRNRIGFELSLSRSIVMICVWPILFTNIVLFGAIPGPTQFMGNMQKLDK